MIVTALALILILGLPILTATALLAWLAFTNREPGLAVQALVGLALACLNSLRSRGS